MLSCHTHGSSLPVRDVALGCEAQSVVRRSAPGPNSGIGDPLLWWPVVLLYRAPPLRPDGANDTRCSNGKYFPPCAMPHLKVQREFAVTWGGIPVCCQGGGQQQRGE